MRAPPLEARHEGAKIPPLESRHEGAKVPRRCTETKGKAFFRPSCPFVESSCLRGGVGSRSRQRPHGSRHVVWNRMIAPERVDWLEARAADEAREVLLLDEVPRAPAGRFEDALLERR